MAANGFDPATFDPYRALGVARGATSAQIKRAHRTLAKRYHPDAATGDTARFLAVHEAYRMLSDPLLRREWDDKHAPGPVRADAPPARKSRRTAAHHSHRAADADVHAAPRSKHAHHWSASEVPWWEEGTARNRRARRPAAARPEQPASDEQAADAHQDAPPDFEVYNRSSGAAWSMAARAYFRRGDEDLPRRGQFHYEGTQVVTAGRARMAQQRAARQSAAPETGPSPAAQREPSAKAAAHEESGGSVLGRLRSRLRGTSR